MSGFQITITDVGRAALINAQNDGTVAFTLSQVGVSTQHVPAGLAGLTLLPNERKRLATMAGDVVADDTLHVTIRDESADAYALRAFGIYTSAGVLFAVYSQAEPILEKSTAAMLLLAIDSQLVALGTAMVEFGPTGFTLPPASETVAGIVEIANDAEVDAGVDPWRVITARTLKRALGALSGFALKVHQHDAADTTSGVFHVGRIPALDMSKITGLAIAMAGKAAEVHTHAMNQIVGLTDALAGKAAAVHQHVADDIVSGVLAVARIPTLGMEKITGLATALAGKVNKGGDTMSGSLNVQGVVYENGEAVWTPTRFNPNAKANVQNPDFYGQLNLESGPARFRTLGDGDSLFLQAGTATSNNGHLIFSGLFGQNLTSLRAQVGGGLRDIFHTGNLDPSRLLPYRPEHDHLSPNARSLGLSSGDHDLGSGLKGWAYWTHMRPGGTYGAQIAVSDTAEEVWVRRKSDNNWQAWHQIHTTATLNPATKVDVFNPDGWPHTISLGWNGDRMVARVDAAVAHHLVHQGDAASAGDAMAGGAGDRFITPASLWSFARSIGPSGYAQIPGTPLMLQWGATNGAIGEGQVTALLPVAFGGGCLFACAMPRNANSEGWADFAMQIVGRYLDRIVFFAQRSINGTGTISGYEWLALGLVSGTPNPAYGSGGGPGGGGGGGETSPEV